jgi:hypothetical protein
MAKKFPYNAPSLKIALVQHDPILDNLPPLVEKKGDWVLPRRRLTLESLRIKFLNRFPAGFSDPAYLQEERDYKLAAHLRFKKILDAAEIHGLLSRSDYRELAARASKVLSNPVNILSPYENAAFHDAMQVDEAVETFFKTLLGLLTATEVTEMSIEPFFDTVISLPADRGRVATWPVATAFPYLADPGRFMFLKPEVTREAASSLSFDLKYTTEPNWRTYEALQRMGDVYLDLLRPMGARDFVDVQSFIYVTCGGYEGLEANKKKQPRGKRKTDT